MKFLNKKWIALSVAGIMLTVSLAACVPENNDPNPVGSADEYTVTLDYKDETSRPRRVYVKKGESMEEPAEPVRTGYEISEWTQAENGGEAVTFPYTPTGDITLYAQWDAAVYDVTFDFNFEGSTPVVKQIEYNAEVSALAEEELPIYEQHTFRYWTDAKGATVTFPYIVKRDVTFYAAWIEEGAASYQVKFDANGGKSLSGQEGVVSTVEWVEGDAAIEADDLPEVTRDGNKFLGWATDPDAEAPDAVFPYTPEGNVTFYAVWEAETYIVRLNSNYTGAMIDDSYTPTRVQGAYTFEFDGWYSAARGGNKVTLPYEVKGIVNLYAHWIAPLTTPQDNKFDAEFTPFDPNYEFLGYSNSTHGTGVIQGDLTGASSQPYPLLDSMHTAVEPHYVTYLFKPGATLTFRIYSDRAVSGARLFLALSNEFYQYVTYGPESNLADEVYGYQIKVNGTALSYREFTVDGGPNAGGGMYKGGTFDEYQINRTFALVEGWNTIELITNNDAACGGTTQATAPTVDYIRVEASGATLSWHPEYDNLYVDA